MALRLLRELGLQSSCSHQCTPSLSTDLSFEKKAYLEAWSFQNSPLKVHLNAVAELGGKLGASCLTKPQVAVGKDWKSSCSAHASVGKALHDSL